MLPNEVYKLDLYAILQVSPESNENEIKLAYESLISKEKDEDKIKKIKLAYEVLSNKELRKEYNEKIFEQAEFVKAYNAKENISNEVEPNIFDFFPNTWQILTKGPILNRFLMILAIIYLISPVDILPDVFIPGIGYLDDVIVLTIAYLLGFKKIK